MSYLGQDPGDLSPDDMYGQSEIMGNEAGTMPSASCTNPQGCERKPGSDVCLSCAAESEEAMAVVIRKARAA